MRRALLLFLFVAMLPGCQGEPDADDAAARDAKRRRERAQMFAPYVDALTAFLGVGARLLVRLNCEE